MSWQLEAIKTRTPDVRRAMDMKEVIFDKEWLKVAGNPELYYMYRGVSKPEHRELIEKSGLRYDITIIPPMMLGEEFIKTAGHYHPEAVSGKSFPELYQVLEGEAIFLVQRVENFETNRVLDVVICRAKAGDVFVVPNNYGHITINSSNKHRIVMANWVAMKFESLYEPIKKMGGGAYFFTKNGWIKNPRYGELPQIRELTPKRMKDAYGFVNDLKKLEFLKNPLVEPNL